MSKNIPTTTAEDSAKAGDLPSVKERRLESCNFHVVGVGASAGGLEAIEKFFGDMPSDTGAAYVVVQHLSPCLLYTSPSPRDRTRSRMPSSA